MSITSKGGAALLACALLTGPMASPLAAQDAPPADLSATITEPEPAPAEAVEGPTIEGFISARSGDQMQVTGEDGANNVVAIGEATVVRASGGFLGLGRETLGPDALLNGLPVSVETVQGAQGLVATRIALKNKDLKTASMIRNGTAQGFAEQSAATEALRGRVADIDQYNVKGTTNVNFDTGKTALSPQAKSDLCATAASAEQMDNALLLVVGYTDSTGPEEYNQTLSEKRAGRVVNYLQQHCNWKPYRMLTPTGMSEAQPIASNDTAQGKAENRRVSVNILVSKGLDGM